MAGKYLHEQRPRVLQVDPVLDGPTGNGNMLEGKSMIYIKGMPGGVYLQEEMGMNRAVRSARIIALKNISNRTRLECGRN